MDEKIKSARVELGQFLRQRREQLGMDQATLATAVGVTANTMKGVETGRFAWDIDLHIRICEALNLNIRFYGNDKGL